MKLIVPVLPTNEPPLFVQFPFTSRLKPFATDSDPDKVMFWHLALLAPMVGENNNCEEGGMIIFVVDKGTPPHQLPALNQSVLIAPVQVPAVPQLIVRTAVAFAPGQLPVPVAVSVAMKEPAETEGVNVASAGFAFCVQVPSPTPPLQLFVVPVDVAPVIAIAATPLQLLIAVPAETVGKEETLTVTPAQLELLQAVAHLA